MFQRLAVCLACLLSVGSLSADAAPKIERRIDTQLTGKITRVAFSGNGQTLAVATEDQTVKVFDVASGKELLSRAGVTGRVMLSHDGKLLACVTGDQEKKSHEVQIWSLSDGQQQAAIRRLPGAVMSVAFAPDGKLLALGLSWNQSHVVQSRVKTFDAKTGKEQAEICQRSCPDSIPGIIAVCGTALAFSPDGRLLAVGGNAGGGPTGDVAFYSVDSGRKISAGETQRGMDFETLAFSADGKLLATAGYETNLWDVASGKLLWGQARRETLAPAALALTADGKAVLESGSGGVHRLDLASGKVLAKAAAGSGTTTISPGGSRLSVAEGTSIIVYETDSLFDN